MSLLLKNLILALQNKDCYNLFCQMQKILIYTPKITNRIQYVFDFILTQFSGLEFELTANIQFFEASESFKINYSDKKINDEFFLKSDDFMFENNISETLQFDKLNPVGKCFYALSRYEEYLYFEADKHGRFSGAGKVYKTPFVDSYILELQKELKTKFPELIFKKRHFEILLTSDVDQAWKYKNKGFFRTYGGMLIDRMRGNKDEVKNRRLVLSGKKKDPFDTFDYFKSLKEKYAVDIIFFWLMADYHKFDRNIAVNNTEFRKKIKEVSTWAECGIHPSYASNDEPGKLNIEIARLSAVTGKKIKKSRQHYIKLKFPDTYRNLIENNITDDYTMAYADETGFRAGCCTPFYWFDLISDTKTNLKIHPFCAMDVSMKNYMNLSEKEAIEELSRLKKEIQSVNGQMCILVHNSNLNEDWAGWDKVLESIFN